MRNNLIANKENILNALSSIEEAFGPIEFKTSFLKSGKECLDIRPVLPIQSDNGKELSWVMSFSGDRMVVQSLVNNLSVEVIEADFDKWAYRPTSKKTKPGTQSCDCVAARVGELFAQNFSVLTEQVLN